MFKDTHPHLFNIAGPKDSRGDNTLRVMSRAKAPRLYGAPLDKNDDPGGMLDHESEALGLSSYRSLLQLHLPTKAESVSADPVTA